MCSARDREIDSERQSKAKKKEMDVHSQEQNADGTRDVELIDDDGEGAFVLAFPTWPFGAKPDINLARAVLNSLDENAIYPQDGNKPRG